MKKLFLLLLCSPLEAATPHSLRSATAIINSSPVIYSLLLLLSFVSFFLFTYALLALSRKTLLPKAWIKKLTKAHSEQKSEQVQKLLCEKNNPLAQLLECCLKYPTQARAEMQKRLERIGALYWQPISLLYDIANIATMLGLLGTIVGIFQGVSGASHSMEAIFTLFDGLAVAIGTTVAGLSLAVCATLFAAILKWRTTTMLAEIEDKATEMASQITQHP